MEPKKDSQTEVDAVGNATRLNDDLINGHPEPHPDTKGTAKRFGLIILLLLILTLFSSLAYFLFLKPEPPEPAPAPEPKPVTSVIELKGDPELATLNLNQDYTVKVANSSYLIQITKSPKRVIYNGEEVYRGEDLVSSDLSSDGKSWAVQTSRQEVRTKRDETTKILQNTNVDVATFFINGEEWSQKDNAVLGDVTNDSRVVWTHKTGRQTPSQFGEALFGEALYIADDKQFETEYGITSYQVDPNGKNWFATTNNPSTKEVADFYLNGDKKESLDTRILKRISIDQSGNYSLAFCNKPSDQIGVGLIGSDCQISVNGKTRTTISGTVYLAGTLGKTETYAGVDRELKQSFIKNNRSDLALEHRKDEEQDPATTLGVYLNESGDKFAITTLRKLTRTNDEGISEDYLRLNLSINGVAIDNEVDSPSLYTFGTGEDDETFFIYTLPQPEAPAN